MLVHNWKSLWRAWSVWFATLGLALPEVLQFIADNTAMLSLSDADKNWIRVGCLVGVILFRPIQQKAMEPKK